MSTKFFFERSGNIQIDASNNLYLSGTSTTAGEYISIAKLSTSTNFTIWYKKYTNNNWGASSYITKGKLLLSSDQSVVYEFSSLSNYNVENELFFHVVNTTNGNLLKVYKLNIGAR